jgi:hypothetical protein
MTRREYNKIARYESIDTVLTNNANVYSTHTPFLDAAAKLKALVRLILEAGQKQQSAGQPGVTDEKAHARLSLVSRAHEIAAATHAAAITAGMTELAGRSDYSLSSLMRGRDTAVVERCVDIHASASENLPLLAESDVDANTLTEFQRKIDAFEKLKPAPRHRRVTRSVATKSVKTVMKEMDRLLTSRIDRYMVKYKNAQPEFYNEYQKARRIVNHGGRRSVQDQSNVVTLDSVSANTTAAGPSQTQAA